MAEEIYEVAYVRPITSSAVDFMKAVNFTELLYTTVVLLVLVAGIFILAYGMTEPEWRDFTVFYTAGKSALSGENLYKVVGEKQLPFWYFPWTAWMFIPFAVLPEDLSLLVYKIAFIVCAVLIVNNLLSFYNRDFKFLDKVLILSLLSSISLQTMIVGQMEYLLLGLIVLTMYAIDQKKFILAGILFPFLWAKPHLLIVFTLFAFWRGGKQIIASAAITSLLMLFLETLIRPGWHLEMLNILRTSGGRTDGPYFATFPSMLGFQENWTGTGNLPFSLLLIFVAVLAVWKFRSLPTVPLLSLALAASLFCAPRAYAYDLPLLIPAMIWFTAKDFRSTSWIWFIAAIVPPLTRYASGVYLVTLIVFLVVSWKARRETTLFASYLHK